MRNFATYKIEMQVELVEGEDPCITVSRMLQAESIRLARWLAKSDGFNVFNKFLEDSRGGSTGKASINVVLREGGAS